MHKITPFLWFDNQAEEAARFYASVFKDSKVRPSSHYDEEGSRISGQPKESVMTVPFQLSGQDFVALNGGPAFKFTEAVSFVVNCESQEEIDYFWARLSEGGDKKAQQCGWLKDKYGLSWQVVPTVLGELLQDKDAEKSKRTMEVLLKMKKIDIKTLRQAHDGR